MIGSFSTIQVEVELKTTSGKGVYINRLLATKWSKMFEYHFYKRDQY